MAGKKFEKERWEHFRDLVEHLLEPGRTSLEEDVVWYPATDAYEAEDAFVVRLDLSGVRREEVRIRMQDRLLTVHGLRGDGGPVCRKTFHKMEIAKGPFARSIQVPDRFASADARARYTDGILEITLTRPDKPQTEKIEIPVE